ncbi:MAG: hypothetical protein R3F62_05400 [Planctomycetota bacterium]
MTDPIRQRGTQTASTAGQASADRPAEDRLHLDPAGFAGFVERDPRARALLPEHLPGQPLHPDRHPLLRETLAWASRNGQAIVVGPVQGDFDCQLPQVHLDLENRVMGGKEAPWGRTHLVVHDLLHHYVGQLRVRPEDVTPERLPLTQKRIHQAAMLGEALATYATMGGYFSDYGNAHNAQRGEGSTIQRGGVFSFVRSEPAVLRGVLASYTGGEPLAAFLREELTPERLLEQRRGRAVLAWPSLANLSGGRFRDLLYRLEAAVIPRIAPRVFPFFYWNRSVYSVAAFQRECRELARRYTQPWHMQWQADFDDGHSFAEVRARALAGLRGLARKDPGFLRAVPHELGPGGFRVNHAKQQVRLFARALAELRPALDHAPAFQAALDRVYALAQETFHADPRAVAACDARFQAAKAELLARWRAERPLELQGSRRDFLENPLRFLQDPGTRDANEGARTRISWRERWSRVRQALRRIVGERVSAEERAWVLEAYAAIDPEALCAATPRARPRREFVGSASTAA